LRIENPEGIAVGNAGGCDGELSIGNAGSCDGELSVGNAGGCDGELSVEKRSSAKLIPKADPLSTLNSQ
jgi:hypothetical protein